MVEKVVVLSALRHNGAFYEYGLRLAQEGFRTLLVDYSPNPPAGWTPEEAEAQATLWDVTAGNAPLADAIVTSAACERFDILSGFMPPPPVHMVDIGPQIEAAGYQLTLVLSPVHARHVGEWLSDAGALYVACRPEAQADEGVREVLMRLRRDYDLLPKLLADCRGWDEAGAERAARDLARDLNVELAAYMTDDAHLSLESRREGSASNIVERMRAIKQIDHVERAKAAPRDEEVRREQALPRAWEDFHLAQSEPATVKEAVLPVTHTAEPALVPDRDRAHEALDRYLEVLVHWGTLAEEERRLNAELAQAESEARHLQDQPYIKDGEINPEFITRLHRLAVAKEEIRTFRMRSGWEAVSVQLEEQRAFLRNLLNL